MTPGEQAAYLAELEKQAGLLSSLSEGLGSLGARLTAGMRGAGSAVSGLGTKLTTAGTRGALSVAGKADAALGLGQGVQRATHAAIYGGARDLPSLATKATQGLGQGMRVPNLVRGAAADGGAVTGISGPSAWGKIRNRVGAQLERGAHLAGHAADMLSPDAASFIPKLASKRQPRVLRRVRHRR